MKQFLLAVVVGLLMTLLVRVTLFNDDCNLFVVSMTFLIFFVVGYSLIYVLHNLWKNHK